MFVSSLFGVQCKQNKINEKQCEMNRTLLFLMFLLAEVKLHALRIKEALFPNALQQFVMPFTLRTHSALRTDDNFNLELKMGDKKLQKCPRNWSIFYLSSFSHISNFHRVPCEPKQLGMSSNRRRGRRNGKRAAQLHNK